LREAKTKHSNKSNTKYNNWI